ncbi:MAG: phosphodiester glycosidase family protein [Akkermansiaceae bacterium]
MRFFQSTCFALTLLLSACTEPHSEPPPPPAVAAPVTPQALPLPPIPPTPTIAPKVAPKVSPAPPPTIASPKHPLKVRTATLNGTKFTAVTFDRRDYYLKVIDQKGGPGSQFDSAQAAGSGGLAAINGGFFNPDGSPLGLVISGGESRGAFNSASFLGTSILDGQNVTLSTRTNYQRSNELLQTGPRLVWGEESLTGLSSYNERPRSLMIWDGKNHFGLVHANTATLIGLSNNLKSQPLSGFDIKYAVNLDGGTSCDLWVSGSVSGGGFNKNSFFRKKARNYLALHKR